MARIRTVKPSFFRHEKLQDLEVENPGKYIMLVFIGLWGLCDKNGVFEYSPRQIALDILPFIEFEMKETLSILENNSFFSVFEDSGKQYGYIPSFLDHQRISGKESTENSKFPDPKNREATGKQQGSNREATGSAGREGKGKDICVEQARQVIEHLNKKTGSNFSFVDSNIKPIKQRIKETSLEIALAVVDDRCKAWLNDQKMKEYLRPSTLFNATKFAQYSGALGSSKEQDKWY